MVVPRLVRKTHSAFGAQALAVFPAHRLERQQRYHCVPQHRLKIDGIVLDSTLLFIVFSVREPRALEEEKLLHLGVESVLDGIQAAAALARYRDVRSPRDQDPLVH
ncbi:hypothetical protein SA2016_2408 [Sinomonas atrocyanea]|uniref:Uncharacterized protein n=1 Tax=Sinomonas atrocyanea TaxID=37927 RepID=A0A127A1M1_9MICC|nr:hypothetical protein SA2016_2408 [Sinomonas atrocyanea]